MLAKRRAQGALEYLFMVAAALIVILIVVKMLRGKTAEAKEVIVQNNATKELQELANEA
ncbi:MAG: class III signal peptide-containing protein [Thermococcus sp.]|uniref:class III signal peptide-containing protein n=1 Tax=Thermococcus sp. TaxID=35749 RepID=UPI001DCF6736|nr:class III signal peptide-containing protein [Thermococcus sp.]MBO8175182.1 class III signal peptide-containing protein [Thermococcus sp.]